MINADYIKYFGLTTGALGTREDEPSILSLGATDTYDSIPDPYHATRVDMNGSGRILTPSQSEFYTAINEWAQAQYDTCLEAGFEIYPQRSGWDEQEWIDTMDSIEREEEWFEMLAEISVVLNSEEPF